MTTFNSVVPSEHPLYSDGLREFKQEMRLGIPFIKDTRSESLWRRKIGVFIYLLVWIGVYQRTFNFIIKNASCILMVLLSITLTYHRFPLMSD
jgi:hypothetical protein